MLMITAAAVCMSSCITVNVPADQSGQSEQTVIGNDKDVPLLEEEDVVKIVLDRVDGATEDEIVSFGLDSEDGIWVYEGNLIHDGIEYEFEIDGRNGNILEWELDD